jgi:hypothetical protein
MLLATVSIVGQALGRLSPAGGVGMTGGPGDCRPGVRAPLPQGMYGIGSMGGKCVVWRSRSAPYSSRVDALLTRRME